MQDEAMIQELKKKEERLNKSDGPLAQLIKQMVRLPFILFGFLFLYGLIALITVFSVSFILFEYSVIIYYYWQWFLVPLGVPSIKLFHCLGLLFFIQFFIQFLCNTPRIKEKNEKKRKVDWAAIIFGPPFSLALAYLIRHYLMNIEVPYLDILL